MYLTLRNNQLLKTTLVDIADFKRVFLRCLEQYMGILADWVTRGELNDTVGELFIKANER
jgi:hypothetical protein